jgi:hypothetical protein
MDGDLVSSSTTGSLDTAGTGVATAAGGVATAGTDAGTLGVQAAQEDENAWWTGSSQKAADSAVVAGIQAQLDALDGKLGGALPQQLAAAAAGQASLAQTALPQVQQAREAAAVDPALPQQQVAAAAQAAALPQVQQTAAGAVTALPASTLAANADTQAHAITAQQQQDAEDGDADAVIAYDAAAAAGMAGVVAGTTAEQQQPGGQAAAGSAGAALFEDDFLEGGNDGDDGASEAGADGQQAEQHQQSASTAEWDSGEGSDVAHLAADHLPADGEAGGQAAFGAGSSGGSGGSGTEEEEEGWGSVPGDQPQVKVPLEPREDLEGWDSDDGVAGHLAADHLPASEDSAGGSAAGSDAGALGQLEGGAAGSTGAGGFGQDEEDDEIY